MNVTISYVPMQLHVSRSILQYAFKSATCFGNRSLSSDKAYSNTKWQIYILS